MRIRNVSRIALIAICASLLRAQTAGFFDLVQNGSPADVQAAIAKDADGVTALMYAASLESAPILVPALLKKSANAKVADKSGKKAVDYAKQNAKLNGSPALQQLIDAS
jgi:ankyrin repeat protein